MPSDDVILNLKQIAGYPTAGVAGSDSAVVQRGGLGGPYYSVPVTTLVGQGLAGGGPLYVGAGSLPGTVPPPSPNTVFSDVFSGMVDGYLGWNAYWSDAAQADFRVVPGGASGKISFDAGGWAFAASVDASSPIRWAYPMALSPQGYLTVGDQVLLGRDPSTSLEAATLQWVNGQIMASLKPLYGYYQTATVWSFNNRTGQVILNLADVMGAGGAPIWSPVFQGVPTAPSPSTQDNSNQIATTQWVWQAVQSSAASLNLSGYAPLASPAFSGVPTAPTATTGTSTGQLATTAFVQSAVVASTSGVSSFNARTGAITLTGTDIAAAGGVLATGAVTSFNTRTGAITLAAADITAAGGAALVSPAFTGTPTAPTAVAGTSSTQLATCAFVQASISAMTAGVSSFNSRAGAVTLQTNDISAAGGALLASPVFTGAPTAPTASAGTNTAQLATCAYVMAAIANPATVLPLMNGAAAVGTSLLYARQDHVHPTDASLLPLAGGTLTGNLSLATTGATALVLQSPAGQGQGLIGQKSGSQARWEILLGDGTTEASGNVGSDFDILSYSNAGAYLQTPLKITRSTGVATFGAAVQATGYATRSGSSGGFGGNNFNIAWTGGLPYLWIDTTNAGQLAFASDYRIKRNIMALPSMWERVKALRPVSYRHQDYGSLIRQDDVERWGLVAHEVQDTLIENAATGTKDSPTHIQSPNPWTVIAALTKALQEAMARIERLETRTA